MVLTKDKKNNQIEEPALDTFAGAGSSISAAQTNVNIITNGPPASDQIVPKTDKRINEYIEGLRKEGKKVPAHPLLQRKPNYILICKLTGVPLKVLTKKTSAEGLYLSNAVAEIGLESYTFQASSRISTYGQLLESGLKVKERELEGKRLISERVSTTKYHLNRFLRFLKKKEDDVVGSELVEDGAITQAANEIQNKDTRRKFLQEMKWWGKCYLNLLKDEDLPREFSLALSVAMARAGTTIHFLGKEIGTKKHLIRDWVECRSQPTQSNFPIINKIERALKLASGLLRSRIVKSLDRRFKPEDYPEHVIVRGEKIRIRGNGVILQSLRPLLPGDFDKCGVLKKYEMVLDLVENSIGPGTDWAFLSKKRVGELYALKFADSPFVVQDIRNPTGLLEKLRAGGNPISDQFWANLSPKVRQSLEQHNGSNDRPGGIIKLLTAGLNNLLKGAPLFTDDYHAGMGYSAEDIRLIDLKAKGRATAYLNRRLIEEIYPLEINKRPKFTLLLEDEWDQLVESVCSDGASRYRLRLTPAR